MSLSQPIRRELSDLLWSLSDGSFAPTDVERLERLADEYPEVRKLYAQFMAMCGMLQWECSSDRTVSFEQKRNDECGMWNAELPKHTSREWSVESGEHAVPHSAFEFQAPVLDLSAHHSSFIIHHSAFSGALFSYLLAAMIVGVGLLIAWAWKLPDASQMAHQAVPSPSRLAPGPSSKMQFVGRITGMVDCQWSEVGWVERSEPHQGARISLGDKFALSSGLLEITYDTGAKVILQGPVTYEVESSAGGYLSVGKLTAKLEKKPNSPRPSDGRGAGGEGSVTFLHPSSFILHPLFAVRTPTATVTDLGTEFGVEVDKAGMTETHVFLGMVQVEGRAQAGHVPARTLSAGQATRLGTHTTAVDVFGSNQQQFVRKMPAIAALPSRELIGQIDYGDTWTANSPTRAGSSLLLATPESLQVEQCHGNPLRSWVSSAPFSMTTAPNDNSPVRWPGHQVHGSKSGFTEAGADGICVMGIAYGLRDDFVVQFDAVQTNDWIGIMVGDEPASLSCSYPLSVFFRGSGGSYHEIGLYTASKGEINTGLKSGISAPFQWHNYAVRFNLRAKKLTLWVDSKECGTVDLATVNQGMDADRTWADLPWTNRCVSVGGCSSGGVGRVWTDNFRVGSPRETTPPMETDQRAGQESVRP